MLTTDAAYHFAGDGLVRIAHHWRLLSDVSLVLEHARRRVYVSTCIRAILKACLPEVFDRCFFNLLALGEGDGTRQKAAKRSSCGIFSAISIVSLPLEYYSLHTGQAANTHLNLT